MTKSTFSLKSYQQFIVPYHSYPLPHLCFGFKDLYIQHTKFIIITQILEHVITRTYPLNFIGSSKNDTIPFANTVAIVTNKLTIPSSLINTITLLIFFVLVYLNKLPLYSSTFHFGLESPYILYMWLFSIQS